MLKLTITTKPDVAKIIMFSEPNLNESNAVSLYALLCLAKLNKLEYKIECYIPSTPKVHTRAFKQAKPRVYRPYEITGFDD
jgi:hypothetical protein